jgi:hypothetical protein
MRANTFKMVRFFTFCASTVLPQIAGCGRSDENWPEDKTRSLLEMMVVKLELYHQQGRRPMPTTFDEFYRMIRADGDPMADAGFGHDAWGTKYKLDVMTSSQPDTRQYLLRSAGPDRQMNTADDLTKSVSLSVRPATTSQAQ